MANKKIVFLIFIIVINSFNLYSQNNDNSTNDRKEKIKAQKIAFITQSLDLSVSEAQLFWPVYNEYHKKIEKIICDERKLFKFDKIETLTDKEIEAISDKYIDSEVQQADLLKEYHAKLKNVMSPKKILQLYIAEKEFHKKLIKDLKNKQ